MTPTLRELLDKARDPHYEGDQETLALEIENWAYGEFCPACEFSDEAAFAGAAHMHGPTREPGLVERLEGEDPATLNALRQELGEET